MHIKNTYLSIVLACFTGCGSPPPPMPAYQTYRFDPQQKLPPLSPEWQLKFNLIPAGKGKENFKNNIQKLTLENRSALLEILNNINDEKQEKNFLKDLVSFNERQQAHLITIILHLKTRNSELILKLARCKNCLTLFEKLQMLDMIDDLAPKCQELIEEFEYKLEDES